jgi:hypothetical protein
MSLLLNVSHWFEFSSVLFFLQRPYKLYNILCTNGNHSPCNEWQVQQHSTGRSTHNVSLLFSELASVTTAHKYRVQMLGNISLLTCNLKYLFELSSFTNTSYCETAHRLTPGFLVYCLFHIYTFILPLIRAEYYYLLLFSHTTFPFMFNFVQIFL